MNENVIIVDRKPSIQSMPAWTWVGTHHYMLPSRTLIIPREHARDYNGITDTESRHFRSFVHSLPVPRPRSEAERELSLRAQPPRYAMPGDWGDCVYVDISRAYWQFTAPQSLHMEYMPGRYCSVSRKSIASIYPLPLDWKIARSQWVVSTDTGNGMLWDGQRIQTRKMINRYWYPSLRLYVMDALQAAGNIAIAHGAVYINTDGAIIPAKFADLYIASLKALNIDCKVKYYGRTVVHNFASLKIGDKLIGLSKYRAVSSLDYVKHMSERESYKLLSIHARAVDRLQ